MSGLVRTYSAWSRAHSRWSRPLSPSWVVMRTSRPSAGRARRAGPGPAPWSARGRAWWPRAEPRAAASGERRGQGGQLVGQRLAGGGAGGEDDVLAGVGRVGGDRLVLPGLRDTPRADVGRDDIGRRPTPATARCRAARAGSRSRWVSRPSRPGHRGQPVDHLGHRPVPGRGGRTGRGGRNGHGRASQRPPTHAGGTPARKGGRAGARHPGTGSDWGSVLSRATFVRVSGRRGLIVQAECRGRGRPACSPPESQGSGRGSDACDQRGRRRDHHRRRR